LGDIEADPRVATQRRERSTKKLGHGMESTTWLFAVAYLAATVAYLSAAGDRVGRDCKRQMRIRDRLTWWAAQDAGGCHLV
jgi:hypothetical protein